MRAKFLFTIVILLTLLGMTFPTSIIYAQAGLPPDSVVSPGPCTVKTDMQLPFVGTLPVNFHSRTQLPLFSHIPGGITPATVRLYGGKGNVALTPAWLDFVDRINGRNPIIMKYLFHTDSGWQNSSEYGRVEEIAFEGQNLNVLRVSGNKAYIQTFFIDQLQPTSSSINDARIQLFSIVTRDDKLIGSPKGNAYILLIARRGEVLWIPINYLICASRLPKIVQVKTGPSSLNIRAGHAVTELRIGSYTSGEFIQILEIYNDITGDVWGRTDKGWVALKYQGLLMSDWGL